MNTLGIRVDSSKITYAIYDSSNKKIIIKIFKRPSFLKFQDFLKYIRYNLLDILDFYKINYVSIKKIEYTNSPYAAKNISIERVNVEGVIQEALASSNVLDYLIEGKVNFFSILKNKTSDIEKALKDGVLFLDLIKNYGELTPDINNEESREAVFAALVSFERGVKNA